MLNAVDCACDRPEEIEVLAIVTNALARKTGAYVDQAANDISKGSRQAAKT
jgi:hypothetical protein